MAWKWVTRWPVTSLVSGGDLGSRDGAAKQWRTKRTQRFRESKWMWRLGGVTGLPSLGFGPGECDYGERRGYWWENKDFNLGRECKEPLRHQGVEVRK